ncbi:MAG: AMP-binding protein [Bryobacteraceae bacterium]|nr:AMP-binding protein [Bryobacteraceae bacterium]
MSWLWQPDSESIPRTNVWRFLNRLGLPDRESFLKYSTDQLENFWDQMVQETRIDWFEPYTQVLDTSKGVEWAKWFINGRLNIVHNTLDRYGLSAHPAILWEGEDGPSREISFAELHGQTNQLANYLKSLGLRKGDRVAMCMPMVPEVVTVVYACLKLGLVVVPIFSGFGAGAIATRLQDSGAAVIFTGDILQRRGKRQDLESKVREAAAKAPSVRQVVVYPYDTGWSKMLRSLSPVCATEEVDSEHPAFILYTSGTTGKPKGCVHTHAGALAQMSKEIWLAFDHQPDDRFFWLSDIGWMMGPWTIIGNHHFGGTILLYDGAPDYPDADRLWNMLERRRITTFGVSPTAIRVLMRNSDPRRFDLSRLRLLGSTGEPWDDTSYSWFFEMVGGKRCPVINISGGTEIVGCFLFPLPIQPLKACTLGAPAPGMAAAILNEDGSPTPPGQTGYLACVKPAPSMTRGIWGDPERYLETYWSKWPGVWHHGDWASVDEDGCWYLHGRADESMNVAGRKVGPAEVEDALIEHPQVSEAAVIGVPDEVKGEGIVCFVVLKSPVPEKELSDFLVKNLGPTFRPNAIHAVAELPKTQSGKIVRRLIRRKFLGEDLGDTSTVQNPAALEAFRNGA